MAIAHKLLADLAAEVDQGFLEDTFDILGHKYTMRLLSDGETNWKNRYIDGLSSALSIISQRRAATLAIAIRIIDGHNVESLYAPAAPTSDATDIEKAEYERWTKMGRLERQFDASRKLYDYLSLRPDTFTVALFEKFQELESSREELI